MTDKNILTLDVSLKRAKNNSVRHDSQAKHAFTLSVSETVEVAGITAIFGESGSGKTTLLRVIAGLERDAQGEVIFRDQAWLTEKKSVATHQRPIAYVFQEASLFEHLSVRDNLKYAQKRAPQLSDSQHFYQDVVSTLDIEKLLTKRPHELSGGQKQRVALARALLNRPKLLLLDEPLASLDNKSKAQILPYLELLRDKFRLPMLYVSHSLSEVNRLASQVLLISEGELVDIGSPEQVFTRFYSGDKTQTRVILSGEVTEKEPSWHLLKFSFGEQSLWLKDSGEAIGQKFCVQVFARDISLAIEQPRASSILNVLSATVVNHKQDSDPAFVLVKLAIGESFLFSRITAKSFQQLAIGCGDHVWAQIKSVAIAH